jgi:hypothetical protein
MQVENDYDKEVYNGDIGYVIDVDPEIGELTVGFDGRSVTYSFGELDVLVPAYAATIHKSQGSEYRAVIIPVLTQHSPYCNAICSTLATLAARVWSSCRSEESGRRRGSECDEQAAVVQAGRVAQARCFRRLFTFEASCRRRSW